MDEVYNKSSYGAATSNAIAATNACAIDAPQKPLLLVAVDELEAISAKLDQVLSRTANMRERILGSHPTSNDKAQVSPVPNGHLQTLGHRIETIHRQIGNIFEEVSSLERIA